MTLNSHLLSTAQIEAFYRDGFLVISDFFDPQLVDRWQLCWQQFRTRLVDGSDNRNDRFIYGLLPDPIATVYLNEHLSACMQQLLGPDIALYFNRILLKDRECNKGVECHQDMPYFTGKPKISAFIPLELFTKETGGLSFIVGSHKYGHVGQGTIIPEEFGENTIVTPAVEPGGLIIMDFYTWHFSERSLINNDRPVLQLAYQPATDGSYYGEKFGVPEPTLVCGKWLTNRFFSMGQGLIPQG